MTEEYDDIKQQALSKIKKFAIEMNTEMNKDSDSENWKDIIIILLSFGGSAYQTDVVEILELSKSKISITISAMKDAMLVQKIRKGKENLIRLQKEKHDQLMKELTEQEMASLGIKAVSEIEKIENRDFSKEGKDDILLQRIKKKIEEKVSLPLTDKQTAKLKIGGDNMRKLIRTTVSDDTYNIIRTIAQKNRVTEGEAIDAVISLVGKEASELQFPAPQSIFAKMENETREEERIKHLISVLLMYIEQKPPTRVERILYVLLTEKDGKISQPELCVKTNIGRGNISKILKKLEKQNLVFISKENRGKEKTVSLNIRKILEEGLPPRDAFEWKIKKYLSGRREEFALVKEIFAAVGCKHRYYNYELLKEMERRGEILISGGSVKRIKLTDYGNYILDAYAPKKIFFNLLNENEVIMGEENVKTKVSSDELSKKISAIIQNSKRTTVEAIAYNLGLNKKDVFEIIKKCNGLDGFPRVEIRKMSSCSVVKIRS